MDSEAVERGAPDRIDLGAGAGDAFFDPRAGTLLPFPGDGSIDPGWVLESFLAAPHPSLRGWSRAEPSPPFAVRAAVVQDRVVVEVRMTPLSGRPGLDLEYELLNPGPILVRPAFGLRLSVAWDRLLDWSAPGIDAGQQPEPGVRRYVSPRFAAIAAATAGGTVAILFPDRALDALEIGRTASRLEISAVAYHVGLPPRRSATMRARLLLSLDGVSGLEREWRSHESFLATSYDAIEPAREAWAESLPGARDPARELDEPLAGIRRSIRDRSRQALAGHAARMAALARLAAGEITAEEAAALLV